MNEGHETIATDAMHRRTARVASPTSLRAEKWSIGGVSGPAGIRAEKDIEKLRGAVQGGWSHGSPSRERYREA